MFGGGSIQNMLTTLKNNKTQLQQKKKSVFSKTDSPYYQPKTANSQLTFAPNASKEEVTALGKKWATNLRNFGIRIAILSVLGTMVIFFLAYIGYSAYQNNKIELLQAKQEQQAYEQKLAAQQALLKQQEDFELYLTKAEEHINHKSWKNAELSIRKAITIHPENFDAQYTFAKILGYQCKETHTGCNRVEQQFKLLLEEHPNQTAKIKWLQKQVTL